MTTGLMKTLVRLILKILHDPLIPKLGCGIVVGLLMQNFNHQHGIGTQEHRKSRGLNAFQFRKMPQMIPGSLI